MIPTHQHDEQDTRMDKQAGTTDTATASANQQDSDILRECGMDGHKWAAAFMRMHVGKRLTVEPADPTTGTVDEADMICWFCNAIMAGYDEAQRRDVTEDREVESLRWRLARMENIVLPHARAQSNADGFQKGWHAALERGETGDDTIDDLRALVPRPSVPAVATPVEEGKADPSREKG